MRNANRRSAVVYGDAGGVVGCGVAEYLSIQAVRFIGGYYFKWKYSMSIYLNTTAAGAGVSGTVTDFPVLIRLTTTISSPV